MEFSLAFIILQYTGFLIISINAGEISLKKTEEFSSREITIPLHPSMQKADLARVVEALYNSVAERKAP